MNGTDDASPGRLSKFLRMAVLAGVESAIKLHIDRGDDLDARDDSGMTPLMLAAAKNKPKICKLLIGAGANHRLLDPTGKTAFEIALAVGAEAVASVLAAIQSPTTALPTIDNVLDAEPVFPPRAYGGCLSVATEIAEDVLTTQAMSTYQGVADIGRATPVYKFAAAPDDSSDGGEFDLGGWEAECEPVRPNFDAVPVNSATAVQVAISSYKPVDSSAEWDDIDAYLPRVGIAILRSQDPEGREVLRAILLKAIREGSVPNLEVQSHCGNSDGSSNAEVERLLVMIINDLGAEVDERFEDVHESRSYASIADPGESSTEEAAIEEALEAFDRVASPHYEPLRAYQREIQRLRLLSAGEEVQLSKAMQVALEAALDALAAWPEGIAHIIAAGTETVAGFRSLSSIWEGIPSPDQGAPDEEDFADGHSGIITPEDATDEFSEPENDMPSAAANAIFAEAFRRFNELAGGVENRKISSQEIRQALPTLRLNRSFMAELDRAAAGPTPCPAFVCAMADFWNARNRMALANLKLAFFHAKKYPYSGQPIEDLAQEGNIGLLKAVDRYDWRRGFRFSTYATWWIRQSISRYVADKARTIRLPVHVCEKMRQMERVSDKFLAACGREPTTSEFAELMEIPTRIVARMLRISPEPSSIGELPIDEMISRENREASSPDPADLVNEIQLRSALESLISSLSEQDERQAKVIRLRFGFGGQESLTLEQVGRRFKLTRERIRQIEEKALRKLRHPERKRAFASLALGIELKMPSVEVAANRKRRGS